ncbi:MAG TPA: DUF885 domain-containing protein [Acidobacteriota bacterium]|nr:DUF885 domain-containing protein [Acidobacteriota bacterium]
MNLKRSVLFVAVLLLFPSLAGAQEREGAAAELWKIFDDHWEYQMRTSPTWASQLGDRRYNDQWPDVSIEAIGERHEQEKAFAERARKIDPDRLSGQDRVNRQLFIGDLEDSIEGFEYKRWLVPLNQRGGIQSSDGLVDSLRFETEKDLTDWVARLETFPAYMDQTIALMKEGLKIGMVHPKIIMQRIPPQIEAHIVDDPTQSRYYIPFKDLPESIGSEKGEALRQRARQAIAERIVPAFKKFQAFVTGEYLPACFDKVGAWQLPRGEEFYAYRVRSYTTTDMTPQQVHEIGLKEVARIRAQMEAIIEQVDFEGTFDEFLNFLRTDPQFYYEDPQDLLDAYRALSKRIDPELVKLFGRLPRTPYGVLPIPENIAPDTTTAYYSQPAADGSRAGTFYVNLYKPEVRPKYEMEALSIHEAVPGHHLQIALAQELGDLPRFRRFGGYTAFVEGWALYSESLGEEMGFYTNPYSKFGQLTYEMWRAVRLVVDTGMHSMKWPRQKAIDFFAENAAKTKADIVNEIDRYIAWPGQALAYKIGELKIKELRKLAEDEMGEDFDIRAFHDHVLSAGAIPLDLLESSTRTWLEEQKP